MVLYSLMVGQYPVEELAVSELQVS
jgi:hypothetical protein